MLHSHQHGLLTRTVTTSMGVVETPTDIPRLCARRRRLDGLSASRHFLDRKTDQVTAISRSSSKSHVAPILRTARLCPTGADCPITHRRPCLHARLRRTTVEKRLALQDLPSKAPAGDSALHSSTMGNEHLHPPLLVETHMRRTTCPSGASGAALTYPQRAASVMSLAIVRPGLLKAKAPGPLQARGPAERPMQCRSHPCPGC